jgi:hypothetical protein
MSTSCRHSARGGRRGHTAGRSAPPRLGRGQGKGPKDSWRKAHTPVEDARGKVAANRVLATVGAVYGRALGLGV